MTVPCSKNFCAGAYSDWLEINLLSECNARCEWCIDRDGYHPTIRAPWIKIATAAINHGAKNIILLGGEPTLYKNLPEMIKFLSSAGHNVWITTNGQRLSSRFVKNNLSDIFGVNISIHHYDLTKNMQITGLDIDLEKNLKDAVKLLISNGVELRFNCNCIKGYIDTEQEMLKYINFAKNMGVKNVRFAELKNSACNFVDIAKIINYKFGTSDNPFENGCTSNTVIDGVNVNYRQMCGLQTSCRNAPVNPKQSQKKYVLYYDGIIYNGWQQTQKTLIGVEIMMDDTEILELMKSVANGDISPSKAALKIIKGQRERKIKIVDEPIPSLSGGCHY